MWSVNDRATVGVPAAGVLNDARVDTLSIYAGLVKGAVGVTAATNDTFSPFTNLSRIAS